MDMTVEALRGSLSTVALRTRSAMRTVSRLAAVAVLALASLMSIDAAVARSSEPIKIVLGAKTTEKIMAHIAGRALEESDFRVEFIDSAPELLLDMLGSGEAHAMLEFSVVGHEEALSAALANKRVVSLGGRHGNDRDAQVQKLVWSGVKKKWPYAQKLLKNLIIPDDELAALADDADNPNTTVAIVVADWMTANESLVKGWRSSSKNWMKP